MPSKIIDTPPSRSAGKAAYNTVNKLRCMLAKRKLYIFIGIRLVNVQHWLELGHNQILPKLNLLAMHASSGFGTRIKIAQYLFYVFYIAFFAYFLSRDVNNLGETCTVCEMGKGKRGTLWSKWLFRGLFVFCFICWHHLRMDLFMSSLFLWEILYFYANACNLIYLAWPHMK